MVEQVLSQVAMGMAWDAIIAEWRGHVSKEVIAEAVHLARPPKPLDAITNH